MADMHVTTGRGKEWSIVMHFDVPNVNNNVDVNYRAALVASGLGGSTQLPEGDGSNGTIDATEKAAIAAGSIVERSVPFVVESGGTTTAELRGTLRELYAAKEASVIAELQRQLRYFGHTEARA